MGANAAERIAELVANAEALDDGAAAGVGDDVFPNPPIAEEALGDDLDQKLAFLPLTDLGNAERFVARFGEKFLWCEAIGWLAWDGRRWQRDGAESEMILATYRMVRAIQTEADAIRDTNLDFVVKEKPVLVMYSDRVSGWGRASEMAPRLQAIGRLAGPKVEVSATELDADPFLINVGNGTVMLAPDDGAHEPGADRDPVSFRKHDPADRITKLAPVDFAPEATCPTFDAFLEFVQPEAANRRFLHQWFGLSLTGDTSEQKLVFNWGKGRNGKSTLTDIVAHVAGDYGETVPIETFLSENRGRNAGQATPDLAILPGVRYLRTSEPEKGARLAESLIKLVTGGEAIQARHLNRDYFRFYPQFKLTMSGNYRPEVHGSDEGIWRRMVLVPWTVTVPVEAVDTELGDKLKREASGILNRLLDGLRDWFDGGLILPSDIAAATASFREDSDPLGRFLKGCVVAAPGGRVQSSEMHRLFVAWAKANGEREWSATGFGRAMRERGYRSFQSNVIWWLDVALIKVPTDFGDAAAAAAATPPAPEEADYGG